MNDLDELRIQMNNWRKAYDDFDAEQEAMQKIMGLLPGVLDRIVGPRVEVVYSTEAYFEMVEELGIEYFKYFNPELQYAVFTEVEYRYNELLDYDKDALSTVWPLLKDLHERGVFGVIIIDEGK